MARSISEAVWNRCLCAVLGGLLVLGCEPRSEDPSPPAAGTLAEPSQESASAVQPPELFRDVTAERGITFVHRAVEHEHEYFMPRSIGSGVALLDYDNDGRLDLYFVQNSGRESTFTNRLYRQT